MEQAVLHILSSNGWRAEYEFGAEILRMTVELVEFIYGVRSMEVRTEWSSIWGISFVAGERCRGGKILTGATLSR
jgi:hypothetical protein